MPGRDLSALVKTSTFSRHTIILRVSENIRIIEIKHDEKHDNIRQHVDDRLKCQDKMIINKAYMGICSS